ncbi:hypothetical protein E2562_030006 [Oryza meyeriana var. granulata]|uniref:Uncharacterized protein n=1 Tax=Oryza meyeriana var. granulata TaxID=110450 RepID=A0A6G1FE35_9ORYZ|nr:hypothetical protein E2562_030006 [Oryza meyeriana var. granulata]
MVTRLARWTEAADDCYEEALLELSKQQGRLGDLEVDLINLTHTHQQLEEEHQPCGAEIASLKAQLRVHSQQYGQLAEQYNTRTMERNTLRIQLESCQQQIQQLETQLRFIAKRFCRVMLVVIGKVVSWSFPHHLVNSLPSHCAKRHGQNNASPGNVKAFIDLAYKNSSGEMERDVWWDDWEIICARYKHLLPHPSIDCPLFAATTCAASVPQDITIDDAALDLDGVAEP